MVNEGHLKKNFGHEADLRKNRKNLTYVLKKKLRLAKNTLDLVLKNVKFKEKSFILH